MTIAYRFLIDTNIFIGLEDDRTVDPSFAEIVRRSAERGVAIYVHEVALADIARDKNISRQQVSRSKLDKFLQLRGIKTPSLPVLEAAYGPIKKANDEVDVALIYALEVGAVDFLISQDLGLHGRVRLNPLARRVFTVADALAWLKATFESTSVSLPLISEKLAHELVLTDEIFDSLREGYGGFDDWWRRKCVREHRPCWVVTADDRVAGLIVRKNETHGEAETKYFGNKILKICTFKVRPEYRGEKLGELLLKQALWFAQRNLYDLVYVTTFPTQSVLIQLLEFFGFEHTRTRSNGEHVYERSLSSSRLNATGAELLDAARKNYPRFVARAPARAFCVPIQGLYHRRLFPELSFAKPLPLFPAEELFTPSRGDRTPGNTIRKVYLCRATIKDLRPGDLLFFYHSKSPALTASQSLTTVGVLEDVAEVAEFQDLVRLTAKRSVFTQDELQEMLASGTTPLKAINFLLVGHLEPSMSLQELLASGLFRNRPPQSICRLDMARLEPVRARMKFGFDV